MRHAVPLDLGLRDDHGVPDEDAPALRGVVHHHHDARLLTVHHAKRTRDRGERDTDRERQRHKRERLLLMCEWHKVKVQQIYE